MRRAVSLLALALALALFACNRNATTGQRDSGAPVEPGEATLPEVRASAGGPVETAPPNVPEFKPAFAGQTRAPAVHTKTAIAVREIAKDLDRPWAIAFLPDGRMLVTEKHEGRLRIVTGEGKKSAPVAGVPAVDGRDQGGLLDVELGPDFATSRLVYLSYYEPREGGNGLAVARGRLTLGAAPKLDDVEVVFRMMPTFDSTKHAGGRLQFGKDGYLYIMLGERSAKEGRAQAQDLKSHFGKVVRIHPDGKVPKDNPFVDRTEARPEIWSLGHRNILAADFDASDRLWVVEMGPRGGDELNVVERGKDYGWPTIGYGEEYSGDKIHDQTQAEGMEQPVYYWDPVISPGALTIYDGALFPEWKDNFLIAGLSSQALIRLVVEKGRVVGEERLLNELNERIREVVQGPKGGVYLLTDAGTLLELTPRP